MCDEDPKGPPVIDSRCPIERSNLLVKHHNINISGINNIATTSKEELM
jgi:hypothetical protein